MRRFLFISCLLLLLVACRDDEVVIPNVEDDSGPAEVLVQDDYAYQEMTPAQMLAHLVEQTAAIEQFQSTIHSEKALEAGNVKIGGWIDTTYTMQGARDEDEANRRVAFTQDVQAFETTYQEKGYYIAGNQMIVYNSLTDEWKKEALTNFTEANYFYLRPVDVVRALQQVVKEPDYNFVEPTVVELFFELDAEADFTTLYELTFFDIEKTMSYFGGYEWAYTNYPINIHVTADLKKGTIEQYIYRLVEQGMGEQTGILESYFVQNYTYEEEALIEVSTSED